MKETKIKCRAYKKYKGLRRPTCKGGRGCRACWDKFYDTQKLLGKF